MAETTFVLKLSDGSDVMEGLEELVMEKDVKYGMLVSASGSIKSFELVSTQSRGGMEKQKFEGPCDVNSISGKLQLDKGKPLLNVRVSVTSTGFTQYTGQLLKAVASGSLEIGVRKVDMGKIIEA